MIKYFVYLSLFASTIILLATSSGQVTITGTYTDKRGRPIAGAVAELLSDTGTGEDTDTTAADGAFSLSITTVAIDGSSPIPKGFSLGQNYPNPFNPSTRFSISIDQPATFVIYNILGHEVVRKALNNPGAYQLTWGGADASGRPVAAGIYIYALRSGDQFQAKKMTLLDRGNGESLEITAIAESAAITSLAKTTANRRLRLTKPNTTTIEVQLGTVSSDTSLGVITGNVGPAVIAMPPDTVLQTGDTLLLNMGYFIDNDDRSLFMPVDTANKMVGDSMLQYIADAPDTIEIHVAVYDRTDPTLTDSLSFTVFTPFVNGPPVITSPAAATTAEDQFFVYHATATDPDGDNLTYNFIENSTWLTVAGGDSIAGMPTEGVTSGSFRVIASDGALTDTLQVAITVSPVNDPPVAVDDLANTAEDTPVTIGVLANDSDPEGNDLTLAAMTQPAYGTAAIATGDTTILYTPALNWYGEDSFTYTVADPAANLDSATVTITVTPVNNDPPVITSPAAAAATEDQLFVYHAAADEPDGDSLTYIFDEASFWLTTVGGDSIAGIPADEWITGGDFRVIVSDGTFADSLEVTITVTPVNDPPVFTGTIADTAIGFFDSLIIDLEPHFSDAEDNWSWLTYTVNLPDSLWYVAGGQLIINPVSSGTLIGLYVLASDGEDTGRSNDFTLEVFARQVYNVHFVMKDFQTDTTLVNGTSTWTVDGTEYITENGELDLQLLEGTISFNATNPNTIDGTVYSGEDYLFLRRPGQTENFEQRAGPDDSSDIVIAGQDTIYAYKIMSEFPLVSIVPYLNYLGNGSVRFGPDDLDAPAWFDTSGTHIAPSDNIRGYVDDLLTIHLPEVTMGKLNLQYEESAIRPTNLILHMYQDASVPGSGTNLTAHDENSNISYASATWPVTAVTERLIWIEILQAVGDLPDVGGADPSIVSDGENGKEINEFGKDLFNLLYFVLPDTDFN